MSESNKCLSGLYKCPNCEKYYSYDDAFDTKLSEQCELENTYQAVIKCQCGAKHIAGGDLYEFDCGINEKGIMMFGNDYNEETDKGLDIFDAVMLVECEENDSDKVASTYSSESFAHAGRTIYLKPETKHHAV